MTIFVTGEHFELMARVKYQNMAVCCGIKRLNLPDTEGSKEENVAYFKVLL
jgi:hypothetical protein